MCDRREVELRGRSLSINEGGYFLNGVSEYPHHAWIKHTNSEEARSDETEAKKRSVYDFTRLVSAVEGC